MDVTALFQFDRAVSAFFVSGRTPAGIWFFRGITLFGEWYGMAAVLALFALLLLRRRKPGQALWPLVSLSISYLLLTGIKNLVRRERPAFSRLVEAAGFSFPSQHAALSVLFYGWLAFLLLKQEPMWEKCRRAIWAGAILLPLLIGISRMYLNVHYCTDVLAGWALGGFLLWVSTALYTREEKRSPGKNKSAENE